MKMDVKKDLTAEYVNLLLSNEAGGAISLAADRRSVYLNRLLGNVMRGPGCTA
jgi:hypothetical protein